MIWIIIWAILSILTYWFCKGLKMRDKYHKYAPIHPIRKWVLLVLILIYTIPIINIISFITVILSVIVESGETEFILDYKNYLHRFIIGTRDWLKSGI